MNKENLRLDSLSNVDHLREKLLEKIKDRALREKIRHSSSLSFLRTELYKLEHPIIKRESYGYY